MTFSHIFYYKYWIFFFSKAFFFLHHFAQFIQDYARLAFVRISICNMHYILEFYCILPNKIQYDSLTSP